MPQVIEINSLAELEPYRLEWQALAAQTPGASFFHTYDWLAAYWRHFGSGQKFRILVVRSGDETIGILPLVVTPENTKVGAVKVLTYPLHDWGTFYGPIGAQGAATLWAGLQHVANTPRDWQMLDLRFVNAQEHDLGRTSAAMVGAGFGAWEGVWKETAVVAVQGGWNDYWMSRTSKFRNNMRRAERRLKELGEVEYTRYRPTGAARGDDDPRWNDFADVLDLASRSWQGNSSNGTTLSHPSIEPFIRETHALAAQNGMLDMNLLRLNGRLMAFAYNYATAGYVYGMRIGYDAEFAQFSVGNVLYMRALENSFERGDTLYDLGPGSLEIKRPWLTHVMPSRRYTHYPLLAPRAQILRLKRWWTERGAARAAAPAGQNEEPAVACGV